MNNSIIRIEKLKKSIYKQDPFSFKFSKFSLNKIFSRKEKILNFELLINNLEISKGSFTAILGRNGAGKTTLLNCIAGLTEINQGIINVNITKELNYTIKPGVCNISDSCRKKIGVVFQNMALWPHMTVYENIFIPLKKHFPDNNKVVISRTEEWLEKLGLSKYLDKKPHELSGGFKRRVAIARTFAIDPDILLIDEIDANLDPEITEIVMSTLINDFIKNENKTVIMITHRMELIYRFAERVIGLLDGKIILDKSRSNLFGEKSNQAKKFFKEVMDPSKSLLVFGFECLKHAIKISSNTLNKNTSTIFFDIVGAVKDLIEMIEPEEPQLFIIVTRDEKDGKKLNLKAIDSINAFEFNGKHVYKIRGTLEEKRIKKNNKKVYVQEIIRNDIVKFLDNKSYFDVGKNFSKSLIGNMFEAGSENRIKERFGQTLIDNICIIEIPIDKAKFKIDYEYYEFSKNTKKVLLFPMIFKGKVEGVLSIDSCTKKTWEPYILDHLKLIANLGAISIQYNSSDELV